MNGPARIIVTEEPLVVGRASGAGCLLLDPSVSLRHAELLLKGGQLFVRDLGSRSGTCVNGALIKEAELRELHDGDRVFFGLFVYRVCGTELRRPEQAAGDTLYVEHLAIDRDGKRLLEDVSFVVRSGRFVGLLGASGAGKSTLLKCLAGYLPPSSGGIRTDDFDLPEHRDAYHRHIGYVPQDDVFYTKLTVRENLGYSLRLRNLELSSIEQARRIDGILERLQLTNKTAQVAETLSGGERRRLNVGLELLGEPRLLFLDEPTSGLDPANETRLMKQFRELSRSGITVICATHVMENLEKFDQVIILANSSVDYNGSPRELLAKYRVSSFAELYQKLEEQSPWSNALVSAATEPPGLELVPLKPPIISVPPLPLTNQIQVMVERRILELTRDRWLIALLIAQPIVIGLLINLSQIRPTNLDSLFLFASVTAIWLGLNNSARELVRERPIYQREHLLGVRPEGYLASKAIFFGLIGFWQILFLIFTIRWLNLLPKQDAEDLARESMIAMLLVWWTVYLAAVLLGLLVSAHSKSQESALAWLPLIILPQLLLSGVATGLESGSDRTGAFRSLVVLVEHSDDEPRATKGWLLEGASMFTYSRPAQALLQKPPASASDSYKILIWFVDTLHLLLLTILTAAALVASFQRREPSWRDQA